MPQLPPKGTNMTAKNPVTTSGDQAAAADAFPYRVLLGPPVTRTIPIFGLQANAGRPDSEVWSISTKDESGLLDKQAAGRLRGDRFGDHHHQTQDRGQNGLLCDLACI